MTLLNIGLIGCGRISDIYLRNCAAFDGLEITACASLDIEESRAKAAQQACVSLVPPSCRATRAASGWIFAAER